MFSACDCCVAGVMHHHRAGRTGDYVSAKDDVSSPYSGKQTSNVVYDSKAGQGERDMSCV